MLCGRAAAGGGCGVGSGSSRQPDPRRSSGTRPQKTVTQKERGETSRACRPAVQSTRSSSEKKNDKTTTHVRRALKAAQRHAPRRRTHRKKQTKKTPAQHNRRTDDHLCSDHTQAPPTPTRTKKREGNNRNNASLPIPLPSCAEELPPPPPPQPPPPLPPPPPPPEKDDPSEAAAAAAAAPAPAPKPTIGLCCCAPRDGSSPGLYSFNGSSLEKAGGRDLGGKQRKSRWDRWMPHTSARNKQRNAADGAATSPAQPTRGSACVGQALRHGALYHLQHRRTLHHPQQQRRRTTPPPQKPHGTSHKNLCDFFRQRICIAAQHSTTLRPHTHPSPIAPTVSAALLHSVPA